MKSHSAEEIAAKMPAAGPQTVLGILQNYVSSDKGISVNLSETYTNDFANKAS